MIVPLPDITLSKMREGLKNLNFIFGQSIPY